MTGSGNEMLRKRDTLKIDSETLGKRIVGAVMKTGMLFGVRLVLIAMCVGTNTLSAQQRASERRVADPGETQFDVQFLRPSGGPVIPIFEGWYQHPDGSYELSFGYFNVNAEELLEIPLGPNNFIEPKEFDGLQPTTFLPIPEGDRRHWGVFTVPVSADFGNQDVVWTLTSSWARALGAWACDKFSVSIKWLDCPR